MTGTTFTRSVAVALSIIALVVLIGWQLNVPALKSFLSKDMVPMVANSAICFLSSGIILFLNTLPSNTLSNRFIIGLSSLIALTGLLTVVEYLIDVNLGIDQFR